MTATIQRSPDGPLLRVEHLTRRFAGIAAVDDVSFEVARGSITGLIGPNGSGKSTTIDCISGFLKPDAGRVTLDGRDLTSASPETVAWAGMMRTFQNVRIYERLSVLDNLVVAAQDLRRFSLPSLICRAAAPRRAEQALRERGRSHLELVSMQRYADAPAGILSYGQRKLVALAMSLMSEPDLIILDEPLAGVNPTVVRRISALIDRLNAGGQSFVIIEHNVDFVMRHCHQVIVLDQGRKLVEGPPDLVRNDERVLEAYLGGRHAPTLEAALHA
jgi:branched-chain amino acid transport system ATP-binding protein